MDHSPSDTDSRKAGYELCHSFKNPLILLPSLEDCKSKAKLNLSRRIS